MPEIARSVELYNQAFSLAWPHLSEMSAHRPNLSQLLGDAVHRRLRVGESDPVQIAVDAIAEIKAGI